MSIDFQARIDSHLKEAARRTADYAVNVINQDYTWSYGSACYSDKLLIQVWNDNILAIQDTLDEIPSMTFDLAGRTIDAALLEQLHNEVTAWFTAIKEGVST